MTTSVDIALSPDADAFFAALVARGHGAAIVGGAVRDALLGRDVRDLDAVTDATPDEVRAACEDASWCRRVFDVGERFGTLGVVLADGVVVEVSRLRGCTLRADSAPMLAAAFATDAAHRDFTINAMAAEWPAATLLDPTGGRADLAAGMLRAPGDPAERLAEDPLRVLRAARFAAQLGFTLDAVTAAALPAAAPDLARIAVERIRDELTKLLVAPHATDGLEILRRSGALAVVLPEVAALDGVTQPTFHDLDVLSHTIQATAAVPATPVLRWATLLHDLGKGPTRTVEPDGRIRFFRHAHVGADLTEAVCRRLRFSNAERAAVVHLVREHMRLGELPLDNPRAVDRAVRRLDLWADGANPPKRLVSAEDALELEIADFAATAHRAEAPQRRRVLSAAIAKSRDRGTRQPPVSPLSARELMRELELEEGPPVGAAMRAVEDAVADGRIAANDRAGALAVARAALAKLGAD